MSVKGLHTKNCGDSSTFFSQFRISDRSVLYFDISPCMYVRQKLRNRNKEKIEVLVEFSREIGGELILHNTCGALVESYHG